jgi:hypothetical protein
MTNRDRACRFAGTPAAWLVAAALSGAAAGIALAEDNQPAPAAPPAVAPAPPAVQRAAPQPTPAPPPAAQQAAPQPAPPPGTAGAPVTTPQPVPQSPAIAAAPAPPPPASSTPAITAAPAPPPPAAAGSAPPSAPPASADANSGFLHAFGRWWNESVAKFGSNMKDAQQKLDDFNKGQRAAAKEAVKNAAEATKDAATAIVRLPGTRAIEVHQACPNAPNGAPDCQEAAVNACRGKGFNTGKPLDVSSSEKCVATMWLANQKQGECHVETEAILARALCQ